MLNLALGARIESDGRSSIHTRIGEAGHAVYGPYLHLEPGRYVVEFNLRSEGTLPKDHEICATVDVATLHGKMIHAFGEVTAHDLRHGSLAIPLVFQIDTGATFEFRVGVTGRASLLVDDYTRLLKLERADDDPHAVLAGDRFPSTDILPKPAFLLHNKAALRQLYEKGASVRIAGDDVVVSLHGVSFYARVIDDLRFVDEIFFRSAYNFSLGRDCCVIDIGMNIGLVAMTFARRPWVREVHSFEPFPSTHARACANLRLNPELAAKITVHNFGLANADSDITVLIADESDSGCLSIRGSDQGVPKSIVVKTAADILGPIIESARARGHAVIAKVDCEGSEFPIFESLSQAGLLEKISAFMVEWHRVFPGRTQAELIAPLLRHGFVVFDQTGPTDNGFFYAARIRE